jgi:hypothetical protein
VKVRVLAFALGVALASPASACINESGTDRFGRRVEYGVPASVMEEQFKSTRTIHEKVAWARRVIENARYRHTFENLNELAVVLIHFGRTQDAIRLLESLESIFPRHYEVATNLGTAYELAGDDAKALHWIREGIARNPGSHEGSEWVHVRVLEAKLAGTTEQGDSLLGLDFGQGVLPSLRSPLPVGADSKPVNERVAAYHLFVQLDERTDFVRPRDPVVARLFFDLGNLEYAEGTVQAADVAYGMAVEYGHPQTALIARRRAGIQRILAKHGNT